MKNNLLYHVSMKNITYKITYFKTPIRKCIVTE